MFKYDIHVHSSGTSHCGKSSAREMVDAALNTGFSGIVLTNHFYNGNTSLDRKSPWKDFVDVYASEYYDAREYGEKKGINVFFGIEESYDVGKEVLVYGITPEQLSSCADYKNFSGIERLEFFRASGAFLIHAHPFRARAYIPNPDAIPNMKYFDGIECYNHFNQPEENVKAFIFARNINTVMTSGCDVHNAEHFGNAGLDFDKPINTIEELIKNMKSGSYTLIHPFNR